MQDNNYSYKERLRKTQAELEALDARFKIHTEALKKEKKEALRLKSLAEEANRIKTQFLANMSHEIRTPLNSLLGMSDLMMDTELNSLQAQYAKIIKSSAILLLRVVNDVLDFSKIEAGELVLEDREFNFGYLLDEIIDTYASKINARSLDFFVKVSSELPEFVIGDSTRIQQILCTLVSNSIKFTERGYINVELSVNSPNRHFLEVVGTVKDTGIGIDSDKISTLFSAFNQGEESTTRKFGGVGLGLSICKSLCKAMNGHLNATSVPGEGSEFDFKIVLKQARYSPSLAEMPPQCSNKSILVGKADTLLRKEMCSRLSRWGFKVDTAGTSQAFFIAVKQALSKQSPYAALIVDQELFNLNAKAFIEETSAIDPIQGKKLIAMVDIGSGKKNDADKYLRYGYLDVLAKPLRYYAFKNSLCSASKEGEKTANCHQHNKKLHKLQSNYRILVAEDNSDNQCLMRAYLKKLGQQCHIVANGRLAVEAVSSGEWDLVFMDVQMPELNGFEATREIRKLPNGISLPIIALTANAMRGHSSLCIEAGMNDYVSKPVSVRTVHAILEHWLEGGQTRQRFVAKFSELSTAKTLNITALKSLESLGADQKFLRKQVENFKNSWLEFHEFALTPKALAHRDTLRIAAHKFKSSCGVVGAESMRLLCEKLESSALSDGSDVILDRIRLLEDTYRQVINALDAYQGKEQIK